MIIAQKTGFFRKWPWLYPKDRNSVLFNGRRFVLKDYATVIELNSAKVEGHYEADFYAHTPAITSHAFEKGKAYYIGGRLDDDFHREFYSGLINELNIKPAASVKHNKGVSVQVRQAPLCDYIFVMNFTEEEQSFEFESTVKDMVTGEKLAGKIVLGKYEVRVVEKERVD